jgi:hypothetical protein
MSQLHPTFQSIVQAHGAPPPEDEIDLAFNRLMDATQTLIQLKPGAVLTQEMIDDLHLVDKEHREEFERATDAFHRGYEWGLERGGGADTAKLIEERDDARMKAQIAQSMSAWAGRFGFVKGARICREMMARFVEQGGTEAERNIACSIRANWNPRWGDDPGAPDEETYANAGPDEPCDSDGTRSVETACPAPVPQDCQARAEGIAPDAPDIHP